MRREGAGTAAFRDTKGDLSESSPTFVQLRLAAELSLVEHPFGDKGSADTRLLIDPDRRSSTQAASASIPRRNSHSVPWDDSE
ncbi:uncharacterized protein BDV17DRAFT_224673 [Aspergillus undulatus]|uniref:uncharacterized protein n=1 Tax=Aspergillus undulatus TaxID=1810928 RepID=UPI003CCDB829